MKVLGRERELEEVEKVIDGVRTVYPDEMQEEEAEAYVQRSKKKYGSKLRGLEIKLSCDGQDVELYHDVPPVNFQRIRRLTGYLVGTMDRWNDAKRAEERDRVKHTGT